MSEYGFKGWIARGKESVSGSMTWETFQPKTFEEDDVDVEISHCGVCGTDLHTLRSGWYPADYPTCVGHEIAGTVVRVGSNVNSFQVGQKVGVGAQVDSCGKCKSCTSGFENYCAGIVQTYNSRYPSDEKAMGGYGSHWCGPARFVFAIPEGMDPAEVGPMLCGVGIVGIGGLGHFGVLFAKALGADKVVAISRKSDKRDDALALGADEYVATSEDEQWVQKHADSLDLIISTVSHPNMPLNEYLSLLCVHGTFIQLGAPEDVLPSINAFSLIAKGIQIRGSLIGPPAQIREMLQFAADKNLHPIIQTRPMSEANDALVDFEKGVARYRYVLMNEE